MTRPTPQRLEELREAISKRFGWGPELFAEINALRAECAKWKDEYENVCKFATDYESQRDRLRVLLSELTDAASDFFDGTEEDRGHEPEWKALSEALAKIREGLKETS